MKIKRSFCLIMCLIIAMTFCTFPVETVKKDIPLSVDAATRGDYTYVIIDGEATITKVATAISGDVTVPSFFVGCDVVAIGANAFEGCKNMTSVVLPDCVTSIGAGAFKGCDSLRKITTPFVGASVSGSENRFLGYIFGAGSYSAQSQVVPSSLKEVVVTKGSSLPAYSFYKCNSLTSVTMPAEVTTIGASAFYGCSALASFSVPDSLKNVGSDAFSECTALKSVSAQDLKTWCNIGFENVSSNPICNGGTLNLGGQALRSLKVPSDMTKIKQYSFAGYTKLESAYFETSVTQIEKGAFGGCSALGSVTYNGKYSEWKKVTVAAGNDELKKVVCNCLRQPHGDISGDDIVDGNDSTILLKYFNGWDVDIECPYCIDINRDNALDSLDLLILTRYKNGWSVEIN